MPSCNIVIEFSGTLEWVGSIADTVPEHAKSTALFPPFWSHLERVAPEGYRQLVALSAGEITYSGESLTIDDGLVNIVLLTGSIGFDLAPVLVSALHVAGYENIEALVYSDECDYIEDEGGELYPQGILFTMNESGSIEETDYPEVEYDYDD